MLRDIFPFIFTIKTTTIAGGCLWTLVLYISLVGVKDWISDMLNRWFNFAERFLYTSVEEFEETREARESQNAFYASVMSIFPFMIFGFLVNWGMDTSLGNSWSISLGIMACMLSAIYQLGVQNQ